MKSSALRMMRIVIVMLTLLGMPIAPATSMSFERLRGYSDPTFDNAANVFFIDDHRVGAYRDGRLWILNLDKPVRRPDDIEICDWDFVGDRQKADQNGFWQNSYPILVWYDQASQRMLIFHEEEEGGVDYRRFDLKTMEAEQLFGRWPLYLQSSLHDNTQVPTGFLAKTITSKLLIDPLKDDDPLAVSLVYQIRINWESSSLGGAKIQRSIEAKVKGNVSKVGNDRLPIDNIEWTDGKRFVLSGNYNTALGYMEVAPGNGETELKPILGAYVFGFNSFTKYPGIAPDTNDAAGSYLRVLGTWGRKILIVDSSPLLWMIKQKGFLTDYLDEKSNLDGFRKEVIEKPVFNYYRRGETSLFGSAFLSGINRLATLRYNEKSLPFRLVAYDPDTESVTDVGLPYYHLFSYYPFAVNQKGNLLAIAEKDSGTGLFKEWGIYRIVLSAEINQNKVRYRDSPSSKGAILGVLEKDTKVKLLDRTDLREKIEGAEDYWYKVRLESKREAWVFGAFITKLE